MSYRMQKPDGTLVYRQSKPPQATAKVYSGRMPDVSSVLSGETLPKSGLLEKSKGYRCKSSSHLYTFFFFPESHRLIVEFQNGERYLYENVSKTLFEGLIEQDEKKGGSVGRYFYVWIAGKPEKHPFKKLD